MNRSLPNVDEVLPVWVNESVDPERMKTMAALLDDSNPIHFDLMTLKKLGMGDRQVNQGPSNLGYILNMLEEWAGAGSVRQVRVRFSSNVHAGDCLQAGGTVTRVRQEDGRHFIDCNVHLQIDGGDVALAGTATVIWKEH
jgi:acyl dehydratase